MSYLQPAIIGGLVILGMSFLAVASERASSGTAWMGVAFIVAAAVGTVVGVP
jgi:hypothetical protein